MKRHIFGAVYQQLGAIHDPLAHGETVVIEPGSVRAAEIAKAMAAAEREARRANYEIDHAHSDRQWLTLRDLGPHGMFLTITNDAERVVDELLASGVLKVGRRLRYYDSDGQLDEILFTEVGFAGFVPHAALT